MAILENFELLQDILNMQAVQQQSKKLLTLYFQDITIMPVDVIVLLYVTQHPHSSAKNVAAKCHLVRSRVSASVSRMTYSGWLHSRSNPQDRRLSDLTLTGQGYTELAVMKDELQQNIRRVENNQQLTILANDLIAAREKLKEV